VVKEQIVWEYGPFLAYEVRDGKPRVLVPWYFTWEPTVKYPKEEVKRVKRQYESQRVKDRLNGVDHAEDRI
jgi:hypothetical protein